MDKQRNRPSMKEINAEMDAIKKRKPTKEQIEELGNTIKQINEKNEDEDSALICNLFYFNSLSWS